MHCKWWWWLFTRVQGFWENFWHIIPWLCFCCFFKVEISLCTLIPLFRPGSVHCGSVSWENCDWLFPDGLRLSLFPDRFPHYAWTVAQSAHTDFAGSEVYACLGVTCHLHFWQNDQGLLHATVVAGGWNAHQIRVSKQSWLWRRKFSCYFCRDSNSQPFDHESGAQTNKLSQLPL